MKNYKEVYEYYEQNNDIHIGIAEVEQAEHELQDTLDTLIGKIARAYEMQGFCFGYDLATDKGARE